MATICSSRLLIVPRAPSADKRLRLSRVTLSPPKKSQKLPLLRRRSTHQENAAGAEETLGEKGEEAEGEGKGEEGQEAVAAKIRARLAARKREAWGAGELVGGVLEEVREIEWPEFGKVVGTTGVVLAMIAGSSVALLTLNALLAELSDSVFAGKGVYDFFSG
ncbi:hypothetical protein HPP92_009957 [Vanilla planifolia]|uniref:Preprotein translocase subunit SECE1 n=1 Tax=Vanilla planifolia TaxID=51239 RepID=A0A835R1G9_VANPL|nr:hypothetical protein HPP92_009957 [Vanilla planifolia]